MSNNPSLRRCGWSAVWLSEEGIPIRAACGGLPGSMRQTVGNAGRWAAFRANQLRLPLDLVVSGLSSLVSEGLD
eukprot:5752624-Pyramimonas_sp.AAC.1